MDPAQPPLGAANVRVQPSYKMQTAKEEWLGYLGDFYDRCKAGVEGCRDEDLNHVALSVTAARSRAPNGSSFIGYFSEDPERSDIIELLLRRVDQEFDVTGGIDEQNFGLITSESTWAVLQVADMNVMRTLQQELVSADTPAFFSVIEKMLVEFDILFKSCKSYEVYMYTEEIADVFLFFSFRASPQRTAKGHRHPSRELGEKQPRP